MFDRIRQDCGELRPADDVNLFGASGKRIPIRGRCLIQFWIGHALYEYPILVGELFGVDMLIGMDWLIAVEAQLDFERMTIMIGPTQEVSLSTSRREIDPLSKGIGFVRAHEKCIVYARHTTHVPCYTTGGWITS